MYVAAGSIAVDQFVAIDVVVCDDDDDAADGGGGGKLNENVFGPPAK